MAAMESFSPVSSRGASGASPERAARIARVKFLAVPIGPMEGPCPTLGPDPCSGREADPPRAGARLLRLLAGFAFRVIGRPSAARP
jgi:hypothetical protein